jgi:tRNA(His) 5'-end guanylyltransferase
MFDDLGSRMKKYEDCFRHHLPNKTCVIIRLDGKAFHSFCRGMDKPFDQNLRNCMINATLALCNQIQNVKFAYCQSDEISLLLTDYDNIKTDAWFDNNIQKMTSVSASICTIAFNNHSRVMYPKKTAHFDSRVFILPKEEVCNYYLWRQQDATRNSIQMVARTYFSQRECHKKNTSELQDMLMLQKGVNWNNYPTQFKRGVAFYKEKVLKPVISASNTYAIPDMIERRVWKTDLEIPIFSQDRDYINSWI